MTRTYKFPEPDVDVTQFAPRPSSPDAGDDVSDVVAVRASCHVDTRRVEVCGGSLRFTPPWMWVYCLLAVGAHSYLIHRAIGACQAYNGLAWTSEDSGPVWALYFYIVCLVLSVVCAPVYTLASVLRLGNLANDGTRLGHCVTVDDIVDTHLEKDERRQGSRSKLGQWWRVVRKRSGPTASLTMVLATALLLLPPALIRAQKVKYAFSSPVTAYHSDLDPFFPPLHVQSAAAFKPANGSDSSSARDLDLTMTSPEFVCHVTALLIYSVQYAQVFVHTSTHYACLFTLQLLAATAFHAFSFCGESILITMATNERLFPDLDLLLSPSASLLLYVISAFTVFLSSLCVFNYGYSQYMAACSRAIRRITTMSGTGQTVSRDTPPVTHHSVCVGYKVHLTAVVPFMVLLIARVPAIYDYVTAYSQLSVNNGAEVNALMACTVVELAYMLLWLALWMRLTLRQKWSFRVLLCADNVLAKLQAEWNSDAISSASNSQPLLQPCNCTTSRRESLFKPKTVFTISVTRDASNSQREQLYAGDTNANATPLLMRHSSIGARSNHGNQDGGQRVTFDYNPSVDRGLVTPAEAMALTDMSHEALHSPRARRPTDLPLSHASRTPDMETALSNNMTFDSDMPSMHDGYYGHFSGPHHAMSDHQLNKSPLITHQRPHSSMSGQRVMSPPQRQNSLQHPRRRFQAIAEESGGGGGTGGGVKDAQGRTLPPYTMRHARSENVYKPGGPVNILLPWELQSAKAQPPMPARQTSEGGNEQTGRVTSPYGRRPASALSAVTPDRPFEIDRYKLKVEGGGVGGVVNSQQAANKLTDGETAVFRLHSPHPSAFSPASSSSSAVAAATAAGSEGLPTLKTVSQNSTKAPLTNRDSALPSSNESSSNDSGDARVVFSEV